MADASDTFRDEGMSDEQAVAFQIIASSGHARSLAFEALGASKRGDFSTAEDLIAQSQKACAEAHNAQTEMIAKEASGEKVEVDIIVIHAQDHLMTSMLALELISELLEIRKELSELRAGSTA